MHGACTECSDSPHPNMSPVAGSVSCSTQESTLGSSSVTGSFFPGKKLERAKRTRASRQLGKPPFHIQTAPCHARKPGLAAPIDSSSAEKPPHVFGAEPSGSLAGT